MDEDAYPSNPFCSASPHSEPPPPLLPLPLVTPSFANDGISGHRRSGRIQGIRAQTPKKQSSTNSGATQKPFRQNLFPNKRQREESMDGSNFSHSTECRNNQMDQKSPQEKTDVSATDNVVEQYDQNITQTHTDATKSDMDTCRGLAVGHTGGNESATKGWVIGPLFQSFKSKMASFTEIVMSPVKLFRATSPPPSMDHPEKLMEGERAVIGTANVKHSEPFYPRVQSESGTLDTQANQQIICDIGNTQYSKSVDGKFSKKLFNVDLPTHSSETADECAVSVKEKNSPDFVSLEHRSLPCFVSENASELDGSDIKSSILFQPSINFSASHESTFKKSSIGDKKDKQSALLKPLPRKRTGNGSELQEITAKNFPFRKEECDPEASDEQLSSMISLKSNRGDSDDIEKTVPYSSSFHYSQPDTDCPQLDGDEEATKIESCRFVLQSLGDNFNDSTNGRTPTPNVDQLEYSATSHGRGKRGLKLHCHSQDLVKRKKVKEDAYLQTDDRKNMALDSGALRGMRPKRKKAASPDIIVDLKETLIPTTKRQTRANRSEKGGQEWLSMVNETMGNTKTESQHDAMLVCSLDKSNGVLEKDQKASRGSNVKCKTGEIRTGPSKPDVILDDDMDLETTVAICSAKQAEQELLSQVLVCPDINQLCRPSKCRNTKQKPLKRKLTIQASSLMESDITLVSTSSVLSVEPSELTPTNFKTSLCVQRKENLKTVLSHPSKRSKKGFRTTKSSDSGGAKDTNQCFNIKVLPKESQSHKSQGQMSIDPVYFEIAPFESSHCTAPLATQSHSTSSVLLNNEVTHGVDEKKMSSADLVQDIFPTDTGVSRLRSSARMVTMKPKRADNQSRKSRVLHSRTCKGEEMTNSVAMEDVDLAKPATRFSENRFSRRLLRSYSCPEIRSFQSHDTPWTASPHSPHPSSSPSSNQHQSFHTPHVPHPHKSIQRARRHTVCSVEVEREIAPLCLRKEVYPTRRSAPYDSVTQHLSVSLTLSPSTTLSALASCFLSSPLAFLSKKDDSRGSAASPSSSSHVSSPTSSSAMRSSLKSSMWHLPGLLQRTDSSHAILESSSSDGILLERKTERRQQCEEYGEDTSSSSQEFEDVGLREEKALSDSEIKTVQKNEERRKVSSIRIRKTLPKPQNNLTPMGLPKPIRLKKKEFSLEEIYTNKNFSKPPESRLETIFEVPLNRRNGSESWFGQRRVKRFLEFLEVGEARKPKKPLVGVGKTGTSSSRTRRGGFTKEEPSLTVQDVDTLLCAKLDELNLWLIHDQKNT
ncbi:uncharacterized protein prr14 isoform X2 [Channa argus]